MSENPALFNVGSCAWFRYVADIVSARREASDILHKLSFAKVSRWILHLNRTTRDQITCSERLQTAKMLLRLYTFGRLLSTLKYLKMFIYPLHKRFALDLTGVV